ncbi:MAG: hypothetical protein LUI87_15420, partial [Lachnospiraceae bacterium]|nr:hypothetical protein [Lachnospiraceae bacterium]
MFCLPAWIACALSVCAETSDADQWIKTVYNENNGLDTGEANAVLQTSDGYIWIGSYGGLLRYDGVDFENFSIGDNSVGSSSIRALYEDESGRLFIGTNDVGVYVYEDGCFQSVPLEDGGTDYYSVRSFTEDAEGNVYVGTTSGLARIAARTEDADSGSTDINLPDEGSADNDNSDNDSADNDSTNIGSSDDENGDESTKDSSGFYLVPVEGAEGMVVYDLTCDSDGVIWGCAEDSVLLLIKDGELIGTLGADTWFQNDCYSVFASSDGSIYLGSGGSEAVRLERTGSGYDVKDFEVDILDMGGLYAANRFYETSDGTIWVLCDDGIACLDAEDAFETPEGMAGMISCCGMIEDYEGNFWVVSSRTGMTYFSEGKFYNYNDRAGLEGQAVNAIVRQGGFTYLGTDSGLIILDENFEQVENELTEMMESKRVRHITCDSNGVFWFCVYGTGLVRYDPEENGILLLTEEDGLLGNQVRMTLELSDGSLAVAGSSGIDIIRDGEISSSYGSDVLPYSFVLCMYETEDGTLVAGSD